MTYSSRLKPMASIILSRFTIMSGAVFLLGVAARLAFLALHGPKINPDSEKYLTLAQNLLEHGTLSLDKAMPFAPSIRFPPLYPLFIAAISWSGHPSPLVVTVVQAVLGALTAVMILLMARTFLSLRWAFLVSLVYALHPGAVASASAILAETLFTAVLVCGVWVLSLSLKKDKLWLTGLAGLIIGFATLCRALVLLLPVVLFVAILLLRSRHAVAHGFLLIVAALLVITPWSIRSSRAAGKLVTVQDPYLVAALFYVASRWDWNQNEMRWSGFRDEVMRQVAGEQSPETHGVREEIRADIFLLNGGIRNIRSNPGKYLASRARSFPYLFITSYDSFTGIYRSYGTLLAEGDAMSLFVKLILLFIFSLAPFLLGIVGLWSSRESITAMLCASVWLYVLAFYLPLWVEPRYWLPAIPFLLISAVLGANKLWHRFGQSSDRNGSPPTLRLS